MEELKGRLIRPGTMQQHNSCVVLEFIKQHWPVSRADMAQTLGFSKSAISDICALLTDLDLIRSSGKDDPRTGRKSDPLQFNPGGRYFGRLGALGRR